MTRTRWIASVACALLIVGAAVYLRDPPWAGRITSGLRDWETGQDGTRFRWTTGRASFFIPSDATAMLLPLRPLPPIGDRPITVDVRVDDRWLATVELPDPRHPDPNAWVRPTLPLPRRPASRRYRRVDLRVSRWLELSRGVQLGVVQLERPGASR